MYNLMGFVILFKLMFMNLHKNNLDCFSKNNNEEIIKRWYFDFNSFLITFAIVFISQLSGYSTDHNLPLLNALTFQVKKISL